MVEGLIMESRVTVRYFINEYPEDYKGHEFAIEVEPLSHGTAEKVFQGWVDTVEDLKFISKCVGLDYN